MWDTPLRLLPALDAPVVCVTVDGGLIWLRRTMAGDGNVVWLETNARGENIGNVEPEPVAWIHPPRLLEVH